MELVDAIAGRRSVRRFGPGAIDAATVRELVELACLAPAPHHTRPWRFVHVQSQDAKERLSAAMGAAWRHDLMGDGHPPDLIDGLIARSHRRIMDAPVLLLGSIVGDGLRDWPDERRLRFEWMMAAHSMGGALQNLMLAAHDLGLASYWLSAPLFCPEAVRDALNLPADYVPQALVAIGHPDPEYVPRARPAAPSPSVLIKR